MTTKGHCLCGKVEVTVSRPPTDFPTLTCHCQSCKRRSGGVASYAFVIPSKHVTIHSATNSHRTYTDYNTGSGKGMQRSMCTECGSPVCIIEASAPDMRCLQYGLFAQLELPKPELELFRGEACQWEGVVGKEVKEGA